MALRSGGSGGLHALDVTRQCLRVVARGGQDAHGELIGLQLVLSLEREEPGGQRVALTDGVAAPTTHRDERHGGLIGDLTASHLARLLAGGDMRDGVGQHAGEFVFIGGGQDQAGRHEDGPAGKCGGFVNPGVVVIHQLKRVVEARCRRLCRKALPEFVQVGVHRRGVEHALLTAILHGELRAERLFLFDAVEVDAASRSRGLGGKRCAHQQESEPHTLMVAQRRPFLLSLYFPMTRTWKLSGTTVGRPFLPSLPSVAGPYSAASI